MSNRGDFEREVCRRCQRNVRPPVIVKSCRAFRHMLICKVLRLSFFPFSFWNLRILRHSPVRIGGAGRKIQGLHQPVPNTHLLRWGMPSLDAAIPRFRIPWNASDLACPKPADTTRTEPSKL
jgi:hypothetical protein